MNSRIILHICKAAEKMIRGLPQIQPQNYRGSDANEGFFLIGDRTFESNPHAGTNC